MGLCPRIANRGQSPGGETGVQILFRGLPKCLVRAEAGDPDVRVDALLPVHVEANPVIRPDSSP